MVMILRNSTAPMAQQRRRDALAAADRTNTREGLPERSDFARRYDDALIAGDVTPDDVIAALARHYTQVQR